MSGWTMDHTSPKFLDSLKLMCTKGTPEYTAFMTKAGMCMAGCKDDPELFNSEFAGACAWYAAHKSDTCDANAATTTTAAPATITAAPAVTTTVPATNTSTTVLTAPTTTAALSSATSAAASSGVSPVASVASSGASNATAAVSPANGSASSAAPNAAQTGNAASKLQLSGYAVALVAGAGYLAL